MEELQEHGEAVRLRRQDGQPVGLLPVQEDRKEGNRVERERIQVTIQDIINTPKGAPIVAVELTITHVYDQETKQGTNGAYTSQNMIGTDGTDKIRIQVRGCPPIDANKVKGKTVRFESVLTNRGFGGVSNDPYEKPDGSVIHSIKVTSTAKRTIVGGGSHPQAQPVSQPVRQALPTQQATVHRVSEVISPEDVVKKLGALYKICLDAMIQTAATTQPTGCDTMWQTEDVRTMANCVFMEATRHADWKALAVKAAVQVPVSQVDNEMPGEDEEF
jgi:hypothetical protein